jgi:hypothetical protein
MKNGVGKKEKKDSERLFVRLEFIDLLPQFSSRPKRLKTLGDLTQSLGSLLNLQDQTLGIIELE